jgi:hypothetical protein
MKRLLAVAVGAPALLVLLLAAAAHGQGVEVALTPTALEVAPGAEFDLDLTILEPRDSVNGFRAVVGWDAAALTFLPASPLSLQEGALLTGACAERFHRFGQGADTDTITDILLCNVVSIAGPGQLYRLHFRASDTVQETAVRFLAVQFYEDGLYMPLAYSVGASVGIGTPPTVGVEPSPAPRALRLRAAPNPAPGGTVLTIEADRAGAQRLRIVNLAGRVVRRFETAQGVPGLRTIAWDGRDETGRRLPAGVYFATLEIAGRATSSRIVVIR